MQNDSIESFSVHFRAECLNVHSSYSSPPPRRD